MNISLAAVGAAPLAPVDTLSARQHVLIEESLLRVITWVQEHGYCAYEPADGNLSKLFPLTMGFVLPMRVLQQVVLRSPVNIRPVLGIPPHESAIGRGYMAWAYLLLFQRTRAERWRQHAVECLEWLQEHRADGYEEFCWGDPYDYATRGGRRPYGEPLLIWSAMIGQTFVEAFEQLGDRRYLEVAASTAAWILTLPAERTDTGRCLSYVAYRQSSIHNSNAMGAAFLARYGAIAGDAYALEIARDAMMYTCARQRSDGAWLYAQVPKFHWIDSFHTGYNLSALKVYRDASNDRSFDGELARGLRFFTSSFFLPDGCPKYFHDRTYPVDIQCAAQAIDTLASFAGEVPECLRSAIRVATWTIDRLQAADGHFNYRDLGWMTVTTPMLHWGQGTMAKALAVLLNALSGAHV
jgi:hypothetical protein